MINVFRYLSMKWCEWDKSEEVLQPHTCSTVAIELGETLWWEDALHKTTHVRGMVSPARSSIPSAVITMSSSILTPPKPRKRAMASGTRNWACSGLASAWFSSCGEVFAESLDYKVHTHKHQEWITICVAENGWEKRINQWLRMDCDR